MMIDTLLEKAPQWTGGDTPENGRVVMSQCSLVRNLADFPFPARCNEEEKAAVVERVMAVLDNLNLLAEGRFYNLQDLDAAGTRLLSETASSIRDMTVSGSTARLSMRRDCSRMRTLVCSVETTRAVSPRPAWR